MQASVRTRPSRRLLIVLLCLATAVAATFTPGEPAVAQTGLELDDFVFFANDQVHIRPNANVASGDVAARTNAFTTTPEIRLDNGATVSGAGSTTYGDVIQMASGSTVQNAAYNTKQGPGTVIGTATTPLTLPLDLELPTPPVGTPGSTNVTVPLNGTSTLQPGAYATLTAAPGSTVFLEAGEYQFQAWDLRSNVTVTANGAVNVVIAGWLEGDAGLTLAGVAGVDPWDVDVVVLGVDTGAPSQTAATLAGDVSAHVYVPNGSLWLGTTGATATGQFLAKRIRAVAGTYNLAVDTGGPVAPTGVTIVTPVADQNVFGDVEVTVEVTPVEAVGTVDVTVDGTLVDSTAIVDGQASVVWDTTGVADGPVDVTVTARDETGAAAASDMVSVEVANGMDSVGRIQADGEAGLLSVDDYVLYGVQALTNPALLPPGYQSEVLLEEGVTGLGLWFLSPWEAATQQTRDAVAEHLTVTEVMVPPLPAGGNAQRDGLQPAAASAFDGECGDADSAETLPVYVAASKAFRCRHDVFVDGAVRFQIYYNVDGLTDYEAFRDRIDLAPVWPFVHVDRELLIWAETVSATDDEEVVGVPDVIEEMAVSLRLSWDAYAADPADGGLGMRQPGGEPIAVAVHDTPGFVPPPIPGIRQTVQLSNVRDFSYLPRHELYHLFQYQYVGLLDYVDELRILGFCNNPTLFVGACVDAAGYQLQRLNWFQELTAEWAAHHAHLYAATIPGVSPDETVNYARNLDAMLADPARPLVSWDGFGGSLQYGTFVWAEWLEQALSNTPGVDDPTVITRLWEELDANGGDPIAAANELAGGSLADLTASYAIANYLLQTDPITDSAYRDPEVPVWRNALTGSDATKGTPGAALGLDQARPARTTTPIQPGVAVGDTVTIAAGGSAYIELVPPVDGTGEVTMQGQLTVEATVTSGGSPATATVIALSEYPNPCTPPASTDITGTWTDTVTIDPNCQLATLVLTNTADEGSPIEVDWTATLETTGNRLTNPGFETGDLTGWTTFDNTAIQQDEITVIDPSLPDAPEGTYAVAITSLDLLGSSGLEQTVTVTPGDSYSTSVQTHNANGFGPTVTMEIVDDNDEILARDSQTLATDGQWHPLEASFVATTTTVTYRLILEGYQTGESATVQFDDAILQSTQVAANLAFEQGSLAGWTMDPANPDTVFEVRSDGDPASDDPYAAHIVASGLGLGSDQLVRQVETQVAIAEVAVRVAGTPGALAILEVTDSNGVRTDSVTLTGDTTWHQLTVDVAANETVTIRLIADRFTALGGVDVAFDGVYLNAAL